MTEIEYDQPTASPTPKVASAVIAGAVLTVLIGLANAFGIMIPTEVTGAALTVIAGLTTIVTFLAAYLKRDKKPPQAVQAITRNSVESVKG